MPVTPAEAKALADARGYALSGRVDFSGHARERMTQRGIKKQDVYSAFRTAWTCASQPENRWKVIGNDADGDALEVVIRFEDGVMVVTVY